MKKPQNTDIHGGSLDKLKLKNGKFTVKYDFSVNINPLGFPDCLNKILFNADGYVSEYPPVEPLGAEKAIALNIGKKSSEIILANGGTEIFKLILMALNPRLTAWCVPTYSGYGELCSKLSLKYQTLPLIKKGLLFSVDFKGLGALAPALVFICNPNNPTGQLTKASEILDFAAKYPETYIAADESFMDFYTGSADYSLLHRKLPPNIIIIKSLTKTFATAGLRMGYAFAERKLIEKMKTLRQPWTVNGLAQAVIPHLFECNEYLEETRTEVAAMRTFMMKELASIKELAAHPSETNFVLCEIKNCAGLTADELRLKLLEKGIFIRSCSTINGLGQNYIRLAVRPKAETAALLEALRSILSYKAVSKKKSENSAKALMVVGTASNSGKSIVTAAFCRYFANRKLKVAPFKAQNMALNSFVTRSGGEIGRAQVVQAQACRIEPEIEMNPVLLKPLGDSTSQVIVNGKAFKVLSAVDYYKHKSLISAKAFAAYDRLKTAHDLIVLEGAGSPAEINLLKEDFVNMRMAEHADACTVLVADIDRGGVFASIFGTIKLLPPKWRKLIKGIIINKFRGDKKLLAPGIKDIEELTGIPVLGVLPYLKDLAIEEEDSLGLEKRSSAFAGNSLNIAVIRLPRMSNYTDFMPLENIEGLKLSYVSNPRDAGEPDLIIIPGTKNTIADMIWLRENGFEKFFNMAKKKGVPVIGICGGFQILGEEVLDPHGVEGKIKTCRGLGLLPLKTVLEKEKELAQVSGYIAGPLPFLKKRTEFIGYEIHAGVTVIKNTGDAVQPLRIIRRRAGRVSEAAGCSRENIFGCYVHGFFDNPAIVSQLAEWLSAKKGKASVKIEKKTADVNAAREESFEKLALSLEENLDMPLLKRLLGV